MDEYLDKETFKKSVEERYCKPCKAEKKDYNGCRCRACWVDDMLDEVECFQSADVAPVVYGRWVEYPRPHYFKCSECKYTVQYRKAMWCNGKREYNYCPNCGAKMDGGADNG